MDKNNLFLIATIIGATLLLFSGPKLLDVTGIAGSWDISQQVTEMGYTPYLVEESDFDYSDPQIFALAKQIKSESTSPEDSIKRTMQYVAQNIKYSSQISVSYCYNEKASTVLAAKKGDCVSMSRLVTALLRAQGIPARTMGGCLSSGIRCGALMAIIPGLEAQTTPLVAGDFKKRGFLHEYVEVWIPDKSWMILEATSGQIFDFNCMTYLDFGYDTDQYNRCTINQPSFWDKCAAY